jgi:phosphate/phosphite/phosphonate ABC transporter binding protein
VLYVKARQADPGLRLLAIDVWQGVGFYTGYVTVLTDSGLTNPADLKGRRLALVDPESASGWLLPRHELRRLGFPIDQSFSEVVLSGDHTRALQLLVDGRVDAAAVSSDTLAMARNRGFDASRVRILLKTGTIPPDVVCARSALPDDLVERFADLLLSLSSRSNEGRAVLPRATHVNGWRTGDPHEYDEIERLMAEEEAMP